MKKRTILIGIVALAMLVGGLLIWNISSVNTNTPVLKDGVSSADWLGVFHDSPIKDGIKTFNSNELGISFNYPDTYVLFENKSSAPDTYNLTVGPKEPILESLTRPTTAGGAPTSMYLTFYRKSESTSLEEWMRTNSGQSNFNSADPTNALTPVTIAGVPGFKYHSSIGMYDSSDYVAFLHKEWVVVGVVYDKEKENRQKDFQTVISSIQLR